MERRSLKIQPKEATLRKDLSVHKQKNRKENVIHTYVK